MSNGSESQRNSPNPGLPRWVWALILIPLFLTPFLRKEGGHPTHQDASELEFSDPDGGRHHLKEFKGKTVLLSFWASWCGPCVAEFPSLQALEKRFEGQPFRLVMLNYGETLADVKTALDIGRVPGLVGFDAPEEKLWKYDIRSIPLSLLIDSTGVIRENYVGEQDWTSPNLIAEVEKWLRDSHP